MKIAIPSAQPDHFVHDRLPPPVQWPELRFDRPELQLPAQVNAVQALFERAMAAGHAERPLFRSDERTLTYAQAQAEVHRIANVLTVDLGLVPGNRVLLRGGNSVAMALAWLGTVQAGLVAVGHHAAAARQGTRRHPHQVAAVGGPVRTPNCRTSSRPRSPPTLAPPAPSCLVFNAGDTDAANSLEALARRHGPTSTPCRTAATDIALLAFTSGTTGTPKAAVHTHRDVLAACETWPRHVLRATPDDIVMGSPPLAFTFGLGGLLVFPDVGRRLVYFPSIAYTPERHGATHWPRGGHHLLHRTHLLPADGRVRPPAWPGPAAHQRERRRRPARCSRASSGKDATGLEMIDGIGATENVPHLHFCCARSGAARRHWAGGCPATKRVWSTTTASRCPLAKWASSR